MSTQQEQDERLNDDDDTPHAFHLNLPPHHMDEHDGVPYVTKFAHQKARRFVEFVHSIQLSEQMFTAAASEQDDMEIDDDEEEEDELNPHDFPDHTRDTLSSITKKCGRLLPQISTLENLKYGGISQTELCEMILHLLRLMTCTKSHNDDNGVSLHFENVGYLYRTPQDEQQQQDDDTPETVADLAQELQRDFALPSPAREVLLTVMINLISNKGPLRAVSNASIYPSGQDKPPRFVMILHWKVLLRMLLRTAPYLDEHQMARVPVDSSARHATIVKRTVQLIRDARHFFDQGVRPPTATTSGDVVLDKTALEIWDMVQTDALFHSHTHACYRATIILYLFSPSRCTSAFYKQVMPYWWQSWTNIDRCPEFDFLYLSLFCRARKYVHDTDFDWTCIRKRLLTHSQYWLQLPIGGTALDKSFPRVMNPRSRSCPPRLKVFVGASSSYEEGIDFVAKVAKLLVAGLGTGGLVDNNISEGTNDVLRFLSFVTPYFHPSNVGTWTFTLGAFLHYFCYELACRVGAAAGIASLSFTHPALVDELQRVQPGPAARPIAPHEVVALMHALLPLCQQALYSKNGHVGRAGEAAMLYLIQMDPIHATPAFVDFATRALDISAVHSSHQAPSALSALTRLVQPALRSNSSILLVRLPEILRLSLAGIDSNDQNKTLRTLIFYRSLTSWVPVGGSVEQWPKLDTETGDDSGVGSDGTMRVGKDLFESLEKAWKSPDYLEAIERLPETSLLRQSPAPDENDKEMIDLIYSEAMSAMSDWALEFLDRVFGLLRASGEREKTGKTASGVATRHSSADVHAARNFSRVLKECALQVFAAMDDQVHALAVRTVCRFLQDETHPSAAKDASFLCQAVAAARVNRSTGEISSPGLDTLIEILTDDLPHHSTTTVVYRLRCLAGAVRLAGPSVVAHQTTISSAIEFALSSPDRHLFKTGCKLLRHTLSTLSESYPISSDSCPRAFVINSKVYLGRCAQLNGDGIKWHIPDKRCVEFASELLGRHVLNKLDWLCENVSLEQGADKRSRVLNSVDVNELRRFLRVVRYSIRGGASILLDQVQGGQSPSQDVVPYEMAGHRLVSSVGEETASSIMSIRTRLSSFLIVLSAVVASDTLYPDSVGDLSENDAYRKILPLISSDPKVCKETCDIALLLLTRRGASFRSQEARTIWKAQKQLATDFSLSAQVDQMAETLQSASLYGEGMAVLYKDGEDAGKTVPRRLLVSRVQLFHDSLQRNSSFEVPRRLRRLNRELNSPRNILFSVKDTLPEMLGYLETTLLSSVPLPLDAYEGITDGLCALCCHSNTQVRASAISVTDYALTRFAWLLAPRVHRLLSAIALKDDDMNGKFGFPSCAQLVSKVNQQGKRKRLAEAVKGVCSILSLSRSTKQLMGTEQMRLRLCQTVCGTDGLISLLPAEEVQKIVHYLQAVFSPYRSKIYYLPRVTPTEKQSYLESLSFANDILAEKTVETDSDSEFVAVHWRKLLLACWFLLSQIDGDDKDEVLIAQLERTWSTCFRILETETGQPLQRVGLGLFGRLTFLAGKTGDTSQLQAKMNTESFCRVLGEALIFDHREDSTVGGGHDAQWSAGVEDIIRDASRNIAPRTLFPFQRTSQSLGSFKVPHSQLVECVLAVVDKQTADVAVGYLLSITKEMASAPPNEDQRNQQITSAEIFAGICGYYMRHSGEDLASIWNTLLLPHLDEVMARIPFSLSSAYFDALRFSLQFAAPKSFYALTEWLVERIGTTLWQPQNDPEDSGSPGSKNGISPSGHGTEGFTAQSKWLYLFSAVLIEMDDSELDGAIARSSWYSSHLAKNCSIDLETPNSDLSMSWNLVVERLLPKLSAALGHPFDSCRDHIARCLFRICYCHRKRARQTASRAPSRSNSMVDLGDATDSEHDPGSLIVRKLATLERSEGWEFDERYNALSTARRFMSYCVQLGEGKFELSEYVIPLLPLAFEALKSTTEDDIAENVDSTEESAAKRALEAEVIKAYRYLIAEISVAAVISYGREMDISRVLDVVDAARQHEKWQVRHASANFLRCFQGAHKFLFSESHAERTMAIVTDLLADERREVSAAAMAALTGILAASPDQDVARLVEKFSAISAKSKMKRQRKGVAASKTPPLVDDEAAIAKEKKRARNQQTSVFFLCAAVLSQPYDTPAFVPAAIASISKHSFERNAPLGVRDTVKKCCAEYKRTHMSDNWDLHRQAFNQEQLEALEDVVSSPHYYA